MSWNAGLFGNFTDYLNVAASRWVVVVVVKAGMYFPESCTALKFFSSTNFGLYSKFKTSSRQYLKMFRGILSQVCN